MNKIPAFLFDLDGTLLDTAPEFANCLNELLHETNRTEIAVDQLRPHVSRGAKGMCSFGFKDLDNIAFEETIKRFLSRYEQTLGQNTVLFEGVAQTIDFLNQNALPWGIVTNKHEKYARPLIQQFPELANAAILVCGDTTSEAKPSPVPLLYAADQLKTSNQHCWYIGDAKTDVIASRAAGMNCAIANYGYLPSDDDARGWLADKYIDNFREILDFI